MVRTADMIGPTTSAMELIVNPYAIHNHRPDSNIRFMVRDTSLTDLVLQALMTWGRGERVVKEVAVRPRSWIANDTTLRLL